MIKKYLLGIIVFLGLGLSYSFASYPAIGMTSQLDNENTCTINSDLSISCDNSNHVLARQWNVGNMKTLNGIFRTNGGIGVFHNQYYNNVLDTGNTWQGIITGNFHICSGNVIGAISGNKSFFPDCIAGFSSIGLNYDQLISKLQSKTPLYWWNAQSYGGVTLGLLYDDFYFSIMIDGYGSLANLNGTVNTGVNFGFGNSLEYNSINWNNNNVWLRPGYIGYVDDNGGIPLNSEQSALNYFEDYYGWDESICYAGIDSLSYLYGQNGVSFQKGKGLSIFDVFSGVYGNSDLDKVYVWLNSQLLNYEQWFDRDGNPMYLSEYNSGTNQVDLYYDNLTFPFANKPVAFYFLADNIESYSTYSTMGSSVVSYCNIKINSGTFDEIIDQADKNNITKYTENYNTNQGLNPDGTNKEYGAWLSSGTEIAFSGNTSIKNSLKNFFDTIDENINVSEGTSTLQILPTWLLSALMFVILFKFLRKR